MAKNAIEEMKFATFLKEALEHSGKSPQAVSSEIGFRTPEFFLAAMRGDYRIPLDLSPSSQGHSALILQGC